MSAPMIVSHVPLWVWLLLAYLVWQGSQALSDHTVPLRRVVLVPIVFIIWGLSGLISRSEGSMAPSLTWMVAAASLIPAGYRIGPRHMTIDRARALVHRTGTPWPLVRNVSLFAAQFAIGMAIAMRPEQQFALGLLRAALSGALAGYFLGWALAFRRQYEDAGRMTA
ncbi:hypothetical protein GLI01_23770 [Gluconacetobacter liquefaciens]|uniref:Transmembrane protein n=1 Tax=Gluconacetobacter liquefaciens TaxID=89584 RepID=A0A370G2M7_GLULI|nr:DUF6622 family protein [Gluconacetobacter liquefaciens]MBB2186456.1 hypothetical protein [Gluconacetobacter liquefaciens]RDI38121.1 hypothetical protein C7453_10458 [Gluconacetobacter liquefaciens]GEB38342.1 hypothetical protein GLI01_23770 [Gluconacetobacter liquefaciens]